MQPIVSQACTFKAVYRKLVQRKNKFYKTNTVTVAMHILWLVWLQYISEKISSLNSRSIGWKSSASCSGYCCHVHSIAFYFAEYKLRKEISLEIFKMKLHAFLGKDAQITYLGKQWIRIATFSDHQLHRRQNHTAVVPYSWKSGR